MKIEYLLWILLCALLAPPGQAANNPPAANGTSSDRARITAKVTLPSGKPAAVGLIRPLSYINAEYADIVDDTISSALVRYGIEITKVTEVLDSVTVRDLRKVIINSKSDILFFSVLKPETIEIFVYDKRNPYFISHRTENMPEAGTDAPGNQKSLIFVAKTAVRNLLVAFLKGDQVPLPRDNDPARNVSTVLGSEDSYRLVESFNREIISNSYFSNALGAALSLSELGTMNSNSVSFEYGYRIGDNLYVEGALEMYAYNIFGLYLKYFSSPKESLIRYSIGAGLAMGVYEHTISDNPGVPYGSVIRLAGLTGALFYPLGDIMLKVEGKALLGGGSSALVFMFLPGLVIAL